MAASDNSKPPKKTRKGAGSIEVLLIEIVKGDTIISAAKTANMSEQTARRRLAEPDIAAQLAELRAESLRSTADRLASLSHGMAVILGDIAADTNNPAGVRVQAADAVLRRADHFRDAAVIEERLLAIERTIEAQRELQASHGLRLAGTR